jgi:hypothetical protein
MEELQTGLSREEEIEIACTGQTLAADTTVCYKKH